LGHSARGKYDYAALESATYVTVLSDDRIIFVWSAVLLRQCEGIRRRHSNRRYSNNVRHAVARRGCVCGAEKARVERLFILEHAPENKITPLTGSQAVGEVMARSFLPFMTRRRWKIP